MVKVCLLIWEQMEVLTQEKVSNSLGIGFSSVVPLFCISAVCRRFQSPLLTTVWKPTWPFQNLVPSVLCRFSVDPQRSVGNNSGKEVWPPVHCFGTWRDVKSTTRSSLGVRRCNSHMLALPMLVNIHFRKYYICNKNKWWLTNQTSWTTWCNFTPRSRARSTTATATKTSLKKWFRADSNLIALIFPPWYSSSNLSKFLWSRILDWLYLSSGKKRRFSRPPQNVKIGTFTS